MSEPSVSVPVSPSSAKGAPASLRQELAPVLAPYQGRRGTLINVLQRVQEELGYLPPEALSEVARALRVPPAEVYGVATFYGLFRLTPTGKNVVRVCRGTACHVKGAAGIRQEAEKHLGLKVGETSADLQFTLEEVTCLGACAIAPTMVVNKETYGELTARKVAEILAEYQGEA